MLIYVDYLYSRLYWGIQVVLSGYRSTRSPGKLLHDVTPSGEVWIAELPGNLGWDLGCDPGDPGDARHIVTKVCLLYRTVTVNFGLYS